MQVVETFGRFVEKWSETAPEWARRLLRTGWEAQNLKFRLLPERSLCPADRYLARMMMDMMLLPLQKPETAVLVSVFTPCQLLQEAGLSAYNVEGFSDYLSASMADQGALQAAEEAGLAETLCSYHKTFIGSALEGLMPAPRCIVYTSIACDANLLTFRYLADYFSVPCFFIDVPSSQTPESVRYVADQLRDLKVFLEQQTGRKIDEDGLRIRTARSRRTLEIYDQAQGARKEHTVAADLVSPLYCGITNNIMLGTEEQERYVTMLLRDVEAAPPTDIRRIYWMHTIPYWSGAVKEALSLRDDVQIVECELSRTTNKPSLWSEDPYEYMALRLVHHDMNGSVYRRIDAGIEHARQTGSCGAVWFNHWGCKQTLGASQLAKKRFEAAGIPMLLLDGDGCDRSHGGEGQTATRLGAFLEMLGQEDSHG